MNTHAQPYLCLKLLLDRPISLWDMIRFLASQPINVVWEIDRFALRAEELKHERGAGTEISAGQRSDLLRFLEELHKFCEALKLSETNNRVALWRMMLQDPEIPSYYPVVCSELDGIKYCIVKGLSKRTAVLIGEENSKFLDQEKLFGECVYERFEKARGDIKEAGNCLAMDLYTAAIFHLMRIAEVGLRKLAKALHVKLARKIEFSMWGNVVLAVEAKLKELRGKANKTPAWDKKLQDYSLLVIDIKAFQYLWRDPVFHSRKQCDKTDSDKARLHIESFMRKLAERMSKK